MQMNVAAKRHRRRQNGTKASGWSDPYISPYGKHCLAKRKAGEELGDAAAGVTCLSASSELDQLAGEVRLGEIPRLGPGARLDMVLTGAIV